MCIEERDPIGLAAGYRHDWLQAKEELNAANERIKELEANVKLLTYNRVIKFDITDEDHLSIKLLEATIAIMQKQIDMLVADTCDEASGAGSVLRMLREKLHLEAGENILQKVSDLVSTVRELEAANGAADYVAGTAYSMQLAAKDAIIAQMREALVWIGERVANPITQFGYGRDKPWSRLSNDIFVHLRELKITNDDTALRQHVAGVLREMADDMPSTGSYNLIRRRADEILRGEK